MNAQVVTIQLPAELYAELKALAEIDEADPVDVIDRLVTAASLHHAWLRDLDALREEISETGELDTGLTKDEVVAKLRQTRHAIFEAEYAHLYR